MWDLQEDSETIMIISTMGDILLGMILGMIVSPFMMKLIKSILQKRKVNQLLREAADLQKRNEIIK